MYYITTCLQVCNFSWLPFLYKTRCFKLQYRKGEYLRATHVYLYNSCGRKKMTNSTSISTFTSMLQLLIHLIINCEEAKIIDLNYGR